MRGLLLLGLACILGFALMGFEMLGSRYLYPYFGGGINTWASLIATVLVALMLGYLLGGALVDRTMSPRLCGVLLAIAGIYLFTIPLWVDPLFAWMLTSVGDGMAGIVLAATILLLLPLTLMSMFTPFAVRLLLTSVDGSAAAWSASSTASPPSAMCSAPWSRPSCWCRRSARAR